MQHVPQQHITEIPRGACALHGDVGGVSALVTLHSIAQPGTVRRHEVTGKQIKEIQLGGTAEPPRPSLSAAASVASQASSAPRRAAAMSAWRAR